MTPKESGRYHLSRLRNGVRFVSAHIPQSQSVSIGIWVHAGGRYERASRAGVSHFIEHLVFKGTRRWSCEQLKRHVEGVGGSLNAFTAEEHTCYFAKVPAAHGDRALEVLTELVRYPRFSAADVEREREVVLEEIRMCEDAPAQYAQDLFHQILWPGHPLGMFLSGTAESVGRITVGDIKDYWGRAYQPRGMAVAIAGNFDPESMEAAVNRAFGSMRPKRLLRWRVAPRPLTRPQARIRTKQTEQTHLCLGTYVGPRGHRDRFAIELAHVVLGANTTSRLFREVREKRGLVYDIGSQVRRFSDTGAFVVSAGCDAAKLEPTLRTMAREFARLKAEPVSRSELRRAQDYYEGQLCLGLEDTLDRMLWIGEHVMGVDQLADPQALLERVRRVEPGAIQRAAQRLFVQNRMHMAVVGPVEEDLAPELLRWSRI